MTWPRRTGAAGGGLLGQGDGVDVDHRGANVLGDLGEVVGEVAGLGMVSGRASEESTVCSLPLTERVKMEPARMPKESVASSAKVA
jgi:hypothetical protein